MVLYRRNCLQGVTFFFTVTLDDRRLSALVDHVALLRAVFRKTRGEQPFSIDAIAVLPDHLHAIMTLPPGDSGFSGRWRRIKGAFTRSVVASGVPVSRDHRGEYALWQKRFWEHTIRDERDFERCADYVHFNPVKHRLVLSQPRGRFPHCIDMFVPACWLGIGAALALLITPISVSVETDPDGAQRNPGQSPRSLKLAFVGS